MGNNKMKKIILLMMLLALAPYAFAGGCDTETDEEGNSDWIDVSYIGPRDDPGCRDNDPVARLISIYVTDTVGEGPLFDYAYVVEKQPKKVISFALDLSNLLRKLEADKSVTFYEYFVESKNKGRYLAMDLQIEKKQFRYEEPSWLLTVNWPGTNYRPQQLWVPQGVPILIFDVIWEASDKEKISTLNLFVEGQGLNVHLPHPNKFSLDTYQAQTHMGLLNSEQTPPIGDVINIREDLDPR